MRWLVVAIGLALALVALDRAVAVWGEHASRSPRRLRRPDRHPRSGGGSGALGDLIEVFQPNHQHLAAEQERQRGEVREVGSAAPPFGIDLEGGVATLEAPDRLPARRRVARRNPNTRSPDMATRSELFVADHADALARADARDSHREPQVELAALELTGVSALDLEVLGEIAARAVQYGAGQLELDEVDLDRESLLELPPFLREVLVELGRAEDVELPAEVAAEWAADEDLGLAPATALPLVTSIVALVTGAVDAGRNVYLWVEPA